jgi:tetratricopeptide (TPR) repeat protein
VSCKVANFGRGRLSAGLLLLLLTACQNKSGPVSPPPRYAILRFENLSADLTLDWTGRAISESLPVALSGALDGPVLAASALGRVSPTLGPRPATAPGISSERSEALVAGASRLITGYIAREAGQIRIAATEQDAATGKTLRVVTATAGSPMAATDQLARGFSPHPRSLQTSNPEAWRTWAMALETSAAQSEDLLRRALQFDPDFGAAWVTLASLNMAQGNRAAAGNVIEQARHHKLDDFSRANLDLAQADLTGDRSARIVAMRKVSDLSPADTLLFRSLAETETGAGQFGAAASDWTRVIAAFPNDGLAWNSLGYARSYAGDYAGALAALREYQRLHPKEANPSDSIGDVNYAFRKFSEAAASYLDAYKKQPAFLQAGDLYKAAWAKFRAGDKAGADSLFSQFRTERGKAKAADDLIELLAGDWLYRTGRESAAVETLRKFPGETAYAQLTIWDLLRGDRAQADKDSAAIGPKVTNPSVFMSRFAAQPSAPAAEWESRAQKTFPPSLTGLRDLALGYALILDGKREAALPVWGRIVNTSTATDFFSRAVYARLQGKKEEQPLLPNPAGFNQFLAILDKL